MNSARDKTCLSLILLRSLHRKHTPALSRWLSLHEEDFLRPSNGLKDTHTHENEHFMCGAPVLKVKYIIYRSILYLEILNNKQQHQVVTF